MDLFEISKQLFAGGFAGCCAKTVVAPFDRTKILLQAQHPYYKNCGVWSCIGKIVKTEGVTSLWKGNSMMMLRVFPYASIQFFSFEKYRNFYNSVLGDFHLNKLFAGSSAGVTAVVCTYPLDLVRARLAFQITGEHKYNGIISAFKQIYTCEGKLPGFYRGMSATVLGMIPYAGVSFYTFNTLKDLCITVFPDYCARPDTNAPDVLVLKLWISLACGSFAGAISQTVSFPLDVARRRMQLAKMLPDAHKFTSISSTLRNVYRDNGITKGLYRGLSINYIRVMPQQAIAYTVYEFMKEYIGLNKSR